MSKTTLSTEFRKVRGRERRGREGEGTMEDDYTFSCQVDVDELDEEKYQDEPEGNDDSDTIATR